MTLNNVLLTARVPVLLCALIAAAPAAQATLVLGSETINTGSGNVSSGADAVNALSSPGTVIYGNVLPGGLSNLLPPPDALANYNFYDDYIINVPAAGVNSVSSTINVGNLLSISSLQVRLYAGDTPNFSPSNVIDGWSTPISAGDSSGIVSVLPLTGLNGGDYVLEIRGLADGSAGGSYSGVVNVAEVPLPASILLLGPALAGLAFVRPRALRADVGQPYGALFS